MKRKKCTLEHNVFTDGGATATRDEIDMCLTVIIT